MNSSYFEEICLIKNIKFNYDLRSPYILKLLNTGYKQIR